MLISVLKQRDPQHIVVASLFFPVVIIAVITKDVALTAIIAFSATIFLCVYLIWSLAHEFRKAQQAEAERDRAERLSAEKRQQHREKLVRKRARQPALPEPDPILSLPLDREPSARVRAATQDVPKGRRATRQGKEDHNDVT